MVYARAAMSGRRHDTTTSDVASDLDLDMDSFDIPVIETEESLFIVIPKLSQ
jgi:hypothetical protein